MQDLDQAGVETIKSCVQGYHIYERILNPTIGEELNCVRETTNSKDPYAGVVMCNRALVGHVQCKMSAAGALFLRCKGTIHCIQLL